MAGMTTRRTASESVGCSFARSANRAISTKGSSMNTNASRHTSTGHCPVCRDTRSIHGCINCKVAPKLSPSDRRCGPCAKVGGGAQHGLCPDPFGDAGVCTCYAASDAHRLQHTLWVEDGPESDAEYDGGLGSSRTILEWEAQEDRAEDWMQRVGTEIAHDE